MKTKLAKGTQGSWFAVTRKGGERLPCVHSVYWQGRTEYHDPFYYDPAIPKHAEYIAAVTGGKKVIVAGGDPTARAGYRGVFLVGDVHFGPSGFTCRFLKRVAE
jgi:hypothetical protein